MDYELHYTIVWSTANLTFYITSNINTAESNLNKPLTLQDATKTKGTAQLRKGSMQPIVRSRSRGLNPFITIHWSP